MTYSDAGWRFERPQSESLVAGPAAPVSKWYIAAGWRVGSLSVVSGLEESESAFSRGLDS